MEPLELPTQCGVTMSRKLLPLRLLLCLELQVGSVALIQVEVDAGELSFDEEVDLLIRQGNGE